jgi:hypothetical protein
VPAGLNIETTLNTASVVKSAAIIDCTVNGSGTITAADCVVVSHKNMDDTTKTVSGDAFAMNFDVALNSNDKRVFVSFHRVSGFSGEVFICDRQQVQGGGTGFYVEPASMPTSGTFAVTPLFSRSGMTPGDKLRIMVSIQ